MQRGGETEEDLPSIDSLPKRSQWPEPSRSKVRSPEPLAGLPHRSRVPRLWAVLDCFPGPQAES